MSKPEFMTNEQKMQAFEAITLKDLIEWLDGCILWVDNSQKTHDGQGFTSRWVHNPHYMRFDKTRFERVYMAPSQRWVDPAKPLMEQIVSKSGAWMIKERFSKTRVKRCHTKDQMMKTMYNLCHTILHFKTSEYDCMIIHKMVSKDPLAFSKNRFPEFQSVIHRISELEKELGKLKTKERELRRQMTVHQDLFPELYK